MPKIHVYALDYLRAVAMLGVLGIHTGAFALGNPDANIHFFVLTDILTRFSVPIFFFISAFGLFLKKDPQKQFSYREFLQRRINIVIIPYVVWSLIYMYDQYLASGNIAIFDLSNIGNSLFFGLGSYHLYFMVLLTWFYLLMPVWRSWVQVIVRKPCPWLVFLYVAQNLFNYYSVSMLTPGTGILWLDTAITYRLNYWVLHYLFIFLLGAICADMYPAFLTWLNTHRRTVYGLGLASIAGMLAYYYHLVYNLGYSCAQTSSTLHQLHPLGIFYTMAMTLMLFAYFQKFDDARHNHPIMSSLRALGENSYVIYLAHPLVMEFVGQWITANDYVRTVPVDIGFYLAAAIISFVISRIIYLGQELFSPLGLLTGSFRLPARSVTGKANVRG